MHIHRMSGPYFENTADLLKQFDLASAPDFFDPVPLANRQVAFSIKRHYPNSIRYKPAFTRKGVADNVVAIWVVYDHPTESGKPIEQTRVPVRVHVTNMSMYRSKHYDYDFEDENSPTKASLEQSLATPKPIGLDYAEDFVFDHAQNTFRDKTGGKMTGIEILSLVFEDHCNTVHWLRGAKLRLKLLAHAKALGLTTAAVDLLTFILKQIFGRTLEEDDSLSTYYRGYKRAAFKKLDEDSITVVGYKTAKRIVILFCTLITMVEYYRYRSGATGGYLSHVSANNALFIIHSIVVLWILDVVVPILLFWVINGLIKLRAVVMFWRINAT